MKVLTRVIGILLCGFGSIAALAAGGITGSIPTLLILLFSSLISGIVFLSISYIIQLLEKLVYPNGENESDDE